MMTENKPQFPPFVETETQPSLDEKMDETGRLVLSERDFARFLEVIHDPAPPTPKLVAAMRAYRQLKADFPDNNI